MDFKKVIITLNYTESNLIWLVRLDEETKIQGQRHKHEINEVRTHPLTMHKNKLKMA